MFGESDSESPRVPSPWDSLISSSPSPSPRPSPTSHPYQSPSPGPGFLTLDSIPRLVPENDKGNVEYKLQLLDPSPARFARLVTQLKWRLLEGGGQAYYELGVADSGALVGLPRAELEQSLETLEMMAGEIGASVIVVKEIEVPAVMADITATQTDKWNGRKWKRASEAVGSEEGSEPPTTVLTWTTSSEAKIETTTTDFNVVPDGDAENLSVTVVLDKSQYPSRGDDTTTSFGSSVHLFSIDPDPDPADQADAEPDEDPFIALPPAQPSFSVDLEISTVFKPRPMRARMHTHLLNRSLMGPQSVKTKRLKKIKHITHPHNHDQHLHSHGHRQQHGEEEPINHPGESYHRRGLTRRQMRDRKREEKRRGLFAFTSTDITDANASGDPDETTDLLSPRGITDSHVDSLSSTPSLAFRDAQVDNPAPALTPAETSTLVSGLEGLYVSVEELTTKETNIEIVDEREDDDDDVFASTRSTLVSMMSLTNWEEGEVSTLVPNSPEVLTQGQSRLIVEALVVRKMSLDEVFLDFSGFALV